MRVIMKCYYASSQQYAWQWSCMSELGDCRKAGERSRSQGWDRSLCNGVADIVLSRHRFRRREYQGLSRPDTFEDMVFVDITKSKSRDLNHFVAKLALQNLMLLRLTILS